MSHVIGGGTSLGWVGVKALLLYLTAIIGFRVGARRTLAEMSPFDFVAAVAVGAIVGRVPNANDTTYVAGAITLVTILVAHALIARLRYVPSIADLVDREPRLLVVNGRVVERELRRAGLTTRDLHGVLRQQGVYDLADVRVAIFEERGRVTVVRASDAPAGAPLLREFMPRAAAGEG